MLTSVAFGREHILFEFDSPILSGPNIPSRCFDAVRCRIAKLRAPILSVSDHFSRAWNHRSVNPVPPAVKLVAIFTFDPSRIVGGGRKFSDKLFVSAHQ